MKLPSNYIKILSAVFVTLLSVVVFIYIYILPQYEKNITDSKKEIIKELTYSAWSSISYFHGLAENNIITIPEAKQQAIAYILTIRYGKNMKDYFWISSIDNEIIGHPYITDKEKFADYKDPTGKYPVREMSKLALEKSEGYIEYYWQVRDNSDEVLPKISFVKLYKPWNWIIGTGSYLDEIDAEITLLRQKVILWSVILFIFLAILLLYILRLSLTLSIEKQQISINLKQSEQSFNRFISESLLPIEIYDTKGNLIQVNKAWQDLWGIQYKNSDKHYAYNILNDHNLQKSENYSQIKKAFTGESVHIPVVKINLHDKDISKWVSIKFFRLGNDKSHVVALYHDLTALIMSDNQLRKLSESIKQAPVSIVITDFDGNIEYVNPRFEQVTGYTYEEVLGKNPRILKSDQSPATLFSDLWATIKKGNVWKGEILNRKKNGELIWESTSIAPIRYEDGVVTHFVAVKLDITRNKKVEQDLIEAREKAIESDKVKSQFIANISHEIRTPMNAIMGFSSFLTEENLDKDTREEFNKHIKINGEILLNLIDDILDMAQIEAGKLKVRMVNCKIQRIMKELHSEFITRNEQFDKKDIEILYHNCINDKDFNILSDPNRFRQIFNNLIGNALKYTERGEIQFGCLKQTHNELTFFVRDTGPGIPHEKQGMIFDLFTQANEKFISQHGGTGLGLPITKSIVEILGGRIWLESEINKGTTFYFTHPVNTPTDSSESIAANDLKGEFYWPGKTILLAEDEETNYQYLKVALKDRGVKLIRVKNGKEALAEFRNRMFDIVLMDVKMPVMDGNEATKAIRTFNKKIPIIAQSAYILDVDLNKMQLLGYTNFITKPYTKQRLLSTLNQYLA